MFSVHFYLSPIVLILTFCSSSSLFHVSCSQKLYPLVLSVFLWFFIYNFFTTVTWHAWYPHPRWFGIDGQDQQFLTLGTSKLTFFYFHITSHPNTHTHTRACSRLPPESYPVKRQDFVRPNRNSSFLSSGWALSACVKTWVCTQPVSTSPHCGCGGAKNRYSIAWSVLFVHTRRHSTNSTNWESSSRCGVCWCGRWYLFSVLTLDTRLSSVVGQESEFTLSQIGRFHNYLKVSFMFCSFKFKVLVCSPSHPTTQVVFIQQFWRHCRQSKFWSDFVFQGATIFNTALLFMDRHLKTTRGIFLFENVVQ